MPHIIIEYAKPIADQHNLDDLCKELFEAAMTTSAFQTPQDIKVRALPVTHWFQQVENSSFVHITVRLLSGRTVAQKQEVTSTILNAAATRLTDVGSISVEIKELDPQTYARRMI